MGKHLTFLVVRTGAPMRRWSHFDRGLVRKVGLFFLKFPTAPRFRDDRAIVVLSSGLAARKTMSRCGSLP